jgi:hypothetical protein
MAPLVINWVHNMGQENMDIYGLKVLAIWVLLVGSICHRLSFSLFFTSFFLTQAVEKEKNLVVNLIRTYLMGLDLGYGGMDIVFIL